MDGNLFQQVDQTLDILRTKYLLSPISYEGIYRREKLEYPYKALREALLNAVIHRNYMITSSIQVRIYADKFLIMNDGKLPEELSVEDLRKNHNSIPRNLLLAEVFYKSGSIESWGRGTLRIINECVQAGLPEPEFLSDKSLFTVYFKPNISIPQFVDENKVDTSLVDDNDNTIDTDKVVEKVVDKIVDKVVENLNNSQQKIILLMRNEPYISATEISKQIEISHRKVQDNIAKLKQKGIIKRIGPDKGGHWEVKGQ